MWKQHHRRTRALVLFSMLGCGFWLASCASAPDPTDNAPDANNGASQKPVVPLEGVALGKDGKPAWDCQKQVPPTGYLQETVFEDTRSTNPLQKAQDTARSRLLSRLCGGGSNCDALEADITPWKIGQSGAQVCTMVVIKKAAVERWKKDSTSVAKLDDALLRAAKELVGSRKKTQITFGKVVDDGSAGGARAEWLVARMQRALTRAGATVSPNPPNAKTGAHPRDVDMIVRGRSFSRIEQQKAVVEVHWQGWVRNGKRSDVRSSEPVIFAADAAPQMNSPAPELPTGDGSLSVTLESRRSGSLCLGEKTQLWLKSDEELHVRVFDLYGKDGALLLFPNEDRPDDTIRAGEIIPLGGDKGFEAVPVPGSEVERFIVIASKSAKKLGRFSSWNGYCRVPTHIAAQLHKGQGFPAGSKVTSDSFRLAQHSDCPEPPGAQVRQQMAQQLDALPECR